MDMQPIEAALWYYSSVADDVEKTRLDFFNKLWQTQAKLAEELAPSYDVSSEGELIACATEHVPVFSLHPVTLTRDAMGKAMDAVAKAMFEGELFPETVRTKLMEMDWSELAFASRMEIASKNPQGYLNDFFEFCMKRYEDENIANLASMVASAALRCLLDKPAREITQRMANTTAHEQHPLHCPVCGGQAAVARVGLTKHNDGRAKELWCAQCGTSWEFERVRCGRCGTKNQSKLHYFNIEGDDAHRLQTCDECGSYMRTVYQDNALAPFSFDVENVLMAKLDEVAYQHALKKLKEQEQSGKNDEQA